MKCERPADISGELRELSRSIKFRPYSPNEYIPMVFGSPLAVYLEGLADRIDAINGRVAMLKSIVDLQATALKGTVEGLARIYDREGYDYGTDAAYDAGCAVLDLLGVEYKKEGR